MRPNNFTHKTKYAATNRQKGICTDCGVALSTPWTEGEYKGYAHHLQPVRHGGDASLDNCVYLCWAHHLLLGHGMAPYDIDEQGGGSDAWVKLSSEDFAFWNGPTDQKT